MEKKIGTIGKTPVVVRSAPPVLKVALILLIVFSMAALIALTWVQSSIRQETENMKDQAIAIEEENRSLEEKLADPGSIENIQDIAREELGLVNPDSVIIDVTE